MRDQSHTSKPVKTWTSFIALALRNFQHVNTCHIIFVVTTVIRCFSDEIKKAVLVKGQYELHCQYKLSLSKVPKDSMPTQNCNQRATFPVKTR